MEGGGWRVEDGAWRVEGGEWRVQGAGCRVASHQPRPRRRGVGVPRIRERRRRSRRWCASRAFRVCPPHLWQTALPPPLPQQVFVLPLSLSPSLSTSHTRGSKSSVSIALICTTRRRFLASASANQGPETGDLTPVVPSTQLSSRASQMVPGSVLYKSDTSW